jgi:hypothetical protein
VRRVQRPTVKKSLGGERIDRKPPGDRSNRDVRSDTQTRVFLDGVPSGDPVIADRGEKISGLSRGGRM